MIAATVAAAIATIAMVIAVRLQNKQTSLVDVQTAHITSIHPQNHKNVSAALLVEKTIRAIHLAGESHI